MFVKKQARGFEAIPNYELWRAIPGLIKVCSLDQSEVVRHIKNHANYLYEHSSFPSKRNARFTLADPTPRLASDVVGGKSGQSQPTTHRDPILIGRMACNLHIRVGWYGEAVLSITAPCERQLHCTRSAPDRPMVSGNIKHVEFWPTTSR